MNRDHPEDIWKDLPQKKINGSVKSLKNICLENICFNVDHWMSYLPNDAHIKRNVVSPFNILSKFSKRFNCYIILIVITLFGKIFLKNMINGLLKKLNNIMYEKCLL